MNAPTEQKTPAELRESARILRNGGYNRLADGLEAKADAASMHTPGPWKLTESDGRFGIETDYTDMTNDSVAEE